MTKSVAIVTGASSGIGRATAFRLAQDFEAVVVVARRAPELSELARAIEDEHATPLAIDLDLSTHDAPQRVIEPALERFGRIDALVNVAGAVPGLDLFGMPDDAWDAAFGLKFHGARRLTIMAWSALKAAQGAVVFLSGNAAVMPRAGAAAIGTINAAIEAMAKAFADRGVEDGVQVNCVSPGAILTDRRVSLLQNAAKAKGIGLEAAKAAFLAQAGVQRFGRPEEIAEMVAFAVSPATRWMTGTVLRMDGGEIRSV
jgi:3-oxoacyl-[acyl-carrier protein] reductase